MGKRVNRNELADFFGVSLPTISSWIRSGCPVLQKGRKGLEYAFDTAEVAKWREDRAVAAAQGDLSQTSIEEARKRYEVARAAREELELAKARREVIEIADVAKIVGEEVSRARTRLISIPTKVRPIADEITGDAEKALELVEAVEAQIYEALSEVVSYLDEGEGADDGGD